MEMEFTGLKCVLLVSFRNYLNSFNISHYYHSPDNNSVLKCGGRAWAGLYASIFPHYFGGNGAEALSEGPLPAQGEELVPLPPKIPLPLV